MDPHEKVDMDAEKIMSNTWDFEFTVKKTLKKLARTTKFHITPLGPSLSLSIYIYIYRYIDKFMSRFQKHNLFDKLMSICQKMSIFQQIYVNISKKCQYFNEFISIFQINVNISTNLCKYFK